MGLKKCEKKWAPYMKKDSKGHFIKPGFTVCGSCLRDDWKNYWVKIP